MSSSAGQFTFAYDALIQTHLAHATAVWIFVAFALAFAVKSPIWPFHTWSPLAYAEAPIAGSMVLSALLAKLGTYGLLRFAVGLLPQAVHAVRRIS
jgi:NADH-quinone oxidoreductase subunit M